KIKDFPVLETFDLLVYDNLCNGTDLIKDTFWRACPSENVRIVDAKTGEWYISRLHRHWTIVEDWEEEGRIEAVKRLQIPFPRIDLEH
ncbi:hypothetical protein P154DRAFT_434114, partial [Amniculicola lignicola CBS 123094]